MPVINCGPTEMFIPRGTTVGQIETIFADGAMLVDETTVAASIQKGPTELPPPPTQERIKQII